MFIVLPSLMAKMAENGVLVIVVQAMSCSSASVSASQTFVASIPAPRTKAETSTLFKEWLQNNPRPYSNDVNEKNVRYKIFKSNLKIIDEHNAMQSSYKLGLNGFSDLTLVEFKNKHLGKRVSCDMETTPFRYANATPLAAVKGIVQIKMGKLLSLSKQELVSCDNSDGNSGCEGGFMYPAFGYIMQNGAASKAAYPYTCQDDPCATQKVSVASITGRENVLANRQKALQ